MRFRRAHVTREFWILTGVWLVFLIVAAIALETGQPQGNHSLLLGFALGINVAAVVMMGAVRRSRDGARPPRP